MERELEVAAHALHADGPDSHSLSPGTLELAELITCWPQLPEPLRQVILTIVRSVNVSHQAISDSAESQIEPKTRHNPIKGLLTI